MYDLKFVKELISSRLLLSIEVFTTQHSWDHFTKHSKNAVTHCVRLEHTTIQHIKCQATVVSSFNTHYWPPPPPPPLPTTTTTTQQYYYYNFYGLLGQPGWAGTRRNIHSLTPIMIIDHPLSTSSFFYDPWHPPCSIYVPKSLFSQSFSKFSLVYLLSWHPPLHTLYISSPNHYLLFATHAHTITKLFCRSTETMSSNASLSLNPLVGTLPCSLMPHIHLTILISAHWSASSFSFLTSQVLLSCNILLCTQLLYNLPLTIKYGD